MDCNEKVHIVLPQQLQNYWEAEDQWCTNVDYDLPVMVEYNFKVYSDSDFKSINRSSNLKN